MKDEGIKEGYKFKSMKLISLEHPDKSSSNDFGAWYSTTKLQNSQIDGYLKWTPKRNSVSTEKYIATFKVKAKDEECSDTFDLCDEVEEEFKIKILVVSKDKRIDTSLNTTFNSNKEFTNDVKFDFTPELNLDFKIENGDLSSAKVELTGVLDFGVLTKFKYDVSKKTNYNKRLVNKIYQESLSIGRSSCLSRDKIYTRCKVGGYCIK